MSIFSIFVFILSSLSFVCVCMWLIRCDALKIRMYVLYAVDNVCAFSINYNLCYALSLSLSLTPCSLSVHICRSHKWIEVFAVVHTPLSDDLFANFPAQCTLWLLCIHMCQLSSHNEGRQLFIWHHSLQNKHIYFGLDMCVCERKWIQFPSSLHLWWLLFLLAIWMEQTAKNARCTLLSMEITSHKCTDGLLHLAGGNEISVAAAPE